MANFSSHYLSYLHIIYKRHLPPLFSLSTSPLPPPVPPLVMEWALWSFKCKWDKWKIRRERKKFYGYLEGGNANKINDIVHSMKADIKIVNSVVELTNNLDVEEKNKSPNLLPKLSKLSQFWKHFFNFFLININLTYIII